MKTSEVLLELADKAWKGGALSADQVLEILRKVEWSAGEDKADGAIKQARAATPSGFEVGYVDHLGQFAEEREPDVLYGKPVKPE